MRPSSLWTWGGGCSQRGHDHDRQTDRLGTGEYAVVMFEMYRIGGYNAPTKGQMVCLSTRFCWLLDGRRLQDTIFRLEALRR